MERFCFVDTELHHVPLAVVLHGEVEVFAFGEDGFGVGGPVEFGGAGGVALEFEFEDVGAGRSEIQIAEGEAGIVAGALEDELIAFDGEFRAFAGARERGGG